MNRLIGNIYADLPQFRVHTSNRPGYIEDCAEGGAGVFNADGMVVSLPADRYVFRPGMPAETMPVLLFEVLSKTARKYDLGTKLPCYKKIPGLRQIIFLESDKPSVTVYERQSPTHWAETELTGAEDFFTVEDQAILLAKIYKGIFY